MIILTSKQYAIFLTLTNSIQPEKFATIGFKQVQIKSKLKFR